MPRKPKSKPPKPPGRKPPALPSVNPAGGEHAPPEEGPPFAIAGIGASAGGLDAVSELLRELPNDTGMAFVVVQHLDPKHPSALSEILGRQTKMPVQQAQNNERVEPNRVYVIPPGKNMVLGDGLLQLAPRTELRGQHRPVDHFLRSLAEEQGHKAIGVILSGTGNDGTLGMQEIKAASGITFAQDDTAEQTSMPRSAIAAGCVDFVLPPDEIARELGRISRHPYVAQAEDMTEEPAFERVLEILRLATGADFTGYKRNTLHRRIARRMLLHKLERLSDYVRYLEAHPQEAEALHQDVLINVTSFFRNPEAFELLQEKVFPRLTADKARHEPLRVWALGCSTGEEAYSIAMAYAEYAERAGRRVPLQVFATDVNGVGIDKARAGIYAKGIAQDVSPERLRRFFVDVDGSYRIAKPIRDMCVFARQNVLTDPPFSRMDMVACRNMLIYLEPKLQQKLLPVLHYALRPQGVLWLGHSETIGTYRDLFQIEDARHKVYLKKSGGQTAAVQMPLAPRPVEPVARAPDTAGGADAHREADRLLLARYAPPGVVVNREFEVVQFRGDTSPYLAPAPGRASLNLLKMLREGLLVGVRGALLKAQREDVPVREENLRMRADGGVREVTVLVFPVKSDNAAEGSLLVLFEEPATGAEVQARHQHAQARRAAEDAAAPKQSRDEELARLQQELGSTREYLQSVIEQQEAANEELQSANEEVQSTNEELQSINEELETSKEEIQASNEELATVNEELQNRNLELTQANDDLSNLLGSVQMPIVMLGRDLRIRRFTPAAQQLLNLIPTDVGRPIRDINLQVKVPELELLLAQVIDTVSVREREVQNVQGRWYSLRLHPYKTADNRIDGVVLVLIDIDNIRRVQQEMDESERRFELLANSAPVLIWVNGPSGNRFVNRAYLEFVGALEESAVTGANWTRYIHPEDRDRYLDTYTIALVQRAPFVAQCRLRRADGEYRWIKSVALPRTTADGEFLGYVGSSLDVTDLREALDKLETADRAKNEFLAMLAHELRNPLAAMRNATEILRHPDADAPTQESAKATLDTQTRNMITVINDLLDVSRITRGTVQLHTQPTELLEVLARAVDAIKHELKPRYQTLVQRLPAGPLWVEGDPTRLEQAFDNLLGNASKFTPDHGTIELNAQIEVGEGAGAGWVAVSVRDNGVGITPEMLPRVFELFAQADNSPQRLRGGLGIGLTLARKVVELHKGSIEARSAGIGEGSEFIVRLPLRAAPRAERTEHSVAEPARPNARRVLIVDDNKDGVRMMTALLKLQGHVVQTAHDGKAGLELALKFKPDVVLLDIGMPELDGYTVAERLRNDPATREARLIAVTGYGREEDAQQARAAGFDHHLTKPVDADQLLRLVAGGKREAEAARDKAGQV